MSLLKLMVRNSMLDAYIIDALKKKEQEQLEEDSRPVSRSSNRRPG